MEKVKVTQKQFDWLEKYKTDDEIDYAINTQPFKKRPDSPIVGWAPSKVAYALYRGYEVESEFKENDYVVYEGMYPKIIGRLVYVEGELMVDTPKYKVPQSLPVSGLRHATKQEIWWFDNDRKVWEIKEDDTLKYTGVLYIVDWFDSENVGFKSSNEKAGKFVENWDYVKEHFRVFCFAEDRKDVD